MIVVDSSALVAILLGEPDCDLFLDAIADADRCLMSAVNAHETATVLRLRHGPLAVERFWDFLAECEIEIVAFDETQVRIAARGFDQYGKGLNPETRLNLADCTAYALAKWLDLPLLFKGRDFTRTDLVSVMDPR